MKAASIVIPCAHGNLISKCVDSILKNTNPKNWQLQFCVVLNGVDYGAVDILRKYQKQEHALGGGSLDFAYYPNRLSHPRAVNFGVDIAKNEFVIKIDDDCQVLDYWGRDIWIDTIYDTLFDPDPEITTGIAALDIHEINYLDVPPGFYAATGFLYSFRKSIFKALGGFDADQFAFVKGCDTDLAVRMQYAGLDVSPIYHTHKSDKIEVRLTGNYPLYHSSSADLRREGKHGLTHREFGGEILQRKWGIPKK